MWNKNISSQISDTPAFLLSPRPLLGEVLIREKNAPYEPDDPDFVTKPIPARAIRMGLPATVVKVRHR